MIFSYMHNMHDIHNMQTNMQHPHFNMQHPCFNMQHPHFNMLNMLSMSKNMSSMDTSPFFIQNTKNNLRYASQNGPHRSGQARFEILLLLQNMYNMQNMQNM